MKILQFCFWIMLTIIIIVLSSSLSGCQTWSSNQSKPIPSTPPSNISNNFNWVANLGILGVILGIIALVFGQSIGIKAVAIGASILAVYFSIIRYSTLFAIGGIILLLISVIGIFYIRLNAWKETIKSVNRLLDAYPQERKKMVEILKRYQSKPTRLLNSILKAEIKTKEMNDDSAS